MKPKNLSHVALLSQATHRELDQKYSSRALNWHPYGMLVPRRRLNLLQDSVSPKNNVLSEDLSLFIQIIENERKCYIRQKVREQSEMVLSELKLNGQVQLSQQRENKCRES